MFTRNVSSRVDHVGVSAANTALPTPRTGSRAGGTLYNAFKNRLMLMLILPSRYIVPFYLTPDVCCVIGFERVSSRLLAKLHFC